MLEKKNGFVIERYSHAELKYVYLKAEGHEKLHTDVGGRDYWNTHPTSGKVYGTRAEAEETLKLIPEEVREARIVPIKDDEIVR